MGFTATVFSIKQALKRRFFLIFSEDALVAVSCEYTDINIFSFYFMLQRNNLLSLKYDLG